jgi:hypothetical protein
VDILAQIAVKSHIFDANPAEFMQNEHVVKIFELMARRCLYRLIGQLHRAGRGAEANEWIEKVYTGLIDKVTDSLW